MYWDNISGLYDFFEDIYNKQCYRGLGKRVAEEIEPSDIVLECACGTGAISRDIAPVCRHLYAADLSAGMLRKARENLSGFDNVTVCRADITHIRSTGGRFDKVIAGNVIHLLDEPYQAVNELLRVCKSGGKVIIPTYINMSEKTNRIVVSAIDALGADFRRQFDLESYKKFFADGGYRNVRYFVIDGRMPCAAAVITKD